MVNFLKYTKIYYIISTIVILAGLFTILRWGYNYSIDFVGGSNLQYQFSKKIPEKDIRSVLQQDKVDVEKISINGNNVLIRTKAIDEKKELAVRQDLEKKLQTKISVLSSETVGPTLGKETIQKTIIAAILGILGILLYMTYAFKNFNFALAAIIALLHDFLVLIGSYALFSHFLGAEVDTLFVTAMLTTMSFSVHDTIIIFDKIREDRRYGSDDQVEYSVNKALTETLVRSLNNSMTVIFMLLALVLLGGSTIRFFVMALLVGTLTGAYSSPFIASPVLVWLEKRKKKK